MEPGSLIWLMRHELRLWWRDLRSQPGGRLIILILSPVMFLFLGIITLNSWLVSQQDPAALELPSSALWVVVILGLILFEFSFLQGINLSLSRLFDRSDLDLLVSSPLPERVIFTSRLLMIILRQALDFWWLWILLGFISSFLPQVWSAFPVMVILLTISASLAMLITLKLVQWIGAKQARSITQLFSLGLAVVLILGSRLIASGRLAALQAVARLFEPDAPLGIQSWIWFPARAALGDLPSLGISLILGLSCAVWAIESLHRSFIRGTQQSITPKRTPTSVPTQLRFRSNLLLLLLLKEWRLILRNPYLIGQIGLELISFFIILFSLSGASQVLQWIEPSHIAAAALAGISSLTVSTLATLCISGEESSDLLRSAPIPRLQIQGVKLLAILLPVWGLLTLGVAGLGWRGIPWGLTVGLGVSATITAALMGLWNTRSVPRDDLAWRQKSPKGDLILSILAGLSSYSWVGIALVARWQFLWIVISLLIWQGLLLSLGYLRSRQLGSTLGL